jgi:hypothetical protein
MTKHKYTSTADLDMRDKFGLAPGEGHKAEQSQDIDYKKRCDDLEWANKSLSNQLQEHSDALQSRGIPVQPTEDTVERVATAMSAVYEDFWKERGIKGDQDWEAYIPLAKAAITAMNYGAVARDIDKTREAAQEQGVKVPSAPALTDTLNQKCFNAAREAYLDAFPDAAEVTYDGLRAGIRVYLAAQSSEIPSGTLIQVLQSRLKKSSEDWRSTRTHQMNLIREAETGVWEEALKLAKEHAPREIRVDDGADEYLRQASEGAYLSYIEKAKSTPCCGWEQKIKSGQFGQAEMDAHAKMNQLLGKHQAYADVRKALREPKRESAYQTGGVKAGIMNAIIASENNKHEDGRRKGHTKLVVTKGGVPYADQAQGVRDFHEACKGTPFKSDDPEFSPEAAHYAWQAWLYKTDTEKCDRDAALLCAIRSYLYHVDHYSPKRESGERAKTKDLVNMIRMKLERRFQTSDYLPDGYAEPFTCRARVTDMCQDVMAHVREIHSLAERALNSIEDGSADGL